MSGLLNRFDFLKRLILPTIVLSAVPVLEADSDDPPPPFVQPMAVANVSLFLNGQNQASASCKVLLYDPATVRWVWGLRTAQAVVNTNNKDDIQRRLIYDIQTIAFAQLGQSLSPQQVLIFGL